MSAMHDHFFALGRRQLLAHHGVSITWTKADGTSAAVTAIVGADAQRPMETDTGVEHVRERVVEFESASVEDPNRGDSCTITDHAGDAVVWSFDTVEYRRAGFTAARVVRAEVAEKTHRGYRR